MKLISPCEGERVFSFPVFTDEFCVKFMEEVLYSILVVLIKDDAKSIIAVHYFLRETGCKN